MEHGQSSVDMFEKFTWKIENFSRLNKDEVYSEPFVLGGYPWRISLFPDQLENFLAIYLEVMQTANMSEGWKRHVKYKVLLFDQLDANMTICRERDVEEFNATQKYRGPTFLPLKGFIVKDTCIVGVEVCVCKSSKEKRVNQTASLICECTNIERLSTVSIESSKHDDEDLVSDALGKVLYFLKTKKVKDLNDQACKKLEDLLDVLEKFKFDVTLLEPYFQSATGMKSLVEKARQVEKLKDIKVALELETAKIMTKLDAAEISLEVEREVFKAKGFKEIDLDSK